MVHCEAKKSASFVYTSCIPIIIIAQSLRSSSCEVECVKSVSNTRLIEIASKCIDVCIKKSADRRSDKTKKQQLRGEVCSVAIIFTFCAAAEKSKRILIPLNSLPIDLGGLVLFGLLLKCHLAR
jgi:hypothetical protein